MRMKLTCSKHLSLNHLQIGRQRDRREYRDAVMWCLAMGSVLQALAIKYNTWHWSDRTSKRIPTTTQALKIITDSFQHS